MPGRGMRRRLGKSEAPNFLLVVVLAPGAVQLSEDEEEEENEHEALCVPYDCSAPIRCYIRLALRVRSAGWFELCGF